jgi:2,3-diketo-5-methylthio-1-phosphopentane phosphatase
MDKVVFVDFDGTITKVDTCQAMVENFAKDGWQEIDKLWQEKKISTRDCANMTFQLFDATLEDIEKLVDSIEIDEYFPDFLAFCCLQNYSLYILSDGYDFIIEKILKKHNLSIPFFANQLIYDGHFQIECPHHNVDCGLCGTCKSGLMNKLRKENQKVIYIGDGFSDTCPASKADIIFAKGSLYKYCLANNIKAIYFDSFRDILNSKVFEAGKDGS